MLPQAFRFSLPGVANDFIALLKDSSLVSVITVVELTKRMTIAAVDGRSWLVPGALCAALYLAMSYPLSRLARRLEARLGAVGDERCSQTIGLSKAFGERAIFEDVSLALARGEALALIGPSGAGKTTLLRCLNGLERADRGDVVVGDIAHRRRARRRQSARARCAACARTSAWCFRAAICSRTAACSRT